MEGKRYRFYYSEQFEVPPQFGITRIGQLLRRTDIVKLPMLFSVLRGDLAMVGPQIFTGNQDVPTHAVSLPLSAFRPGLFAFEVGDNSRPVQPRLIGDLL